MFRRAAELRPGNDKFAGDAADGGAAPCLGATTAQGESAAETANAERSGEAHDAAACSRSRDAAERGQRSEVCRSVSEQGLKSRKELNLEKLKDELKSIEEQIRQNIDQAKVASQKRRAVDFTVAAESQV